MRTSDRRRPLAVLVLLPLLLLVGLLAAGCGTEDEVSGSDDPSETTSAAESEPADEEADGEESADGGTGDPEETPGTDEGTGDDDGDGEASGTDAAVCDPYAEMVEALTALDYDAAPDDLAAEMAPIMKDWADDVPDLEQPESMSDDAWNGLQTLASRVSDLPDDATNADIEAVESDLSAQEQQDVDAAGQWFQANCAPS